MKSWIESAFSNDSVSTTKTSRNTTRKTTTVSAAKKPTVETKLPPLISKIINEPSNKKPANRCPLTVKYEPKKRADLVVHKSKIEQLSSLIDQLTNKQQGSIMIIEGPPGSGKNAALNVLCSEKNIDVMIWSQPNMTLSKIENNETDREYQQEYQAYESQAKLFDQFLFKSSRYISDQIFNTELRTKKLLYMKDIPYFAYRDPTVFQNQLRQFKRYSKYSLVISSTISPIQSNEINPAKVLTQDLRKELNITEITFNPLAASYMLKQVERIAQLENLTFMDSNSINEICQSSDGDLRHAINILELSTVKSKSNSTASTSKKRKLNQTKTKENNPETSSALIQKKDANFSIFRGLGKVLHRKNDPNETNIEIEEKLPNHLKLKYFRKPLIYNPEEIVTKIPISEELTTMYLHQNYLELYGIKSTGLDCETQLESLSRITDNFISADLMNCKLSLLDQSNSVYNTKYKEMPALLSIRSVLFYSYFKTEEKTNSKSLWMPLHKPYNYKCNEMKRQRRQAAQRCLFRDGNTQLASYLIEMQSEFFTTILPFANLKNMYRELAAKYTSGKQFKQNKSTINANSENDPGFFMEENDEIDVKSVPLGKIDQNMRKLYEYDDNANIQILDF